MQPSIDQTSPKKESLTQMEPGVLKDSRVPTLDPPSLKELVVAFPAVFERRLSEETVTLKERVPEAYYDLVLEELDVKLTQATRKFVDQPEKAGLALLLWPDRSQFWKERPIGDQITAPVISEDEARVLGQVVADFIKWSITPPNGWQSEFEKLLEKSNDLTVRATEAQKLPSYLSRLCNTPGTTVSEIAGKLKEPELPLPKSVERIRKRYEGEKFRAQLLGFFSADGPGDEYFARVNFIRAIHQAINSTEYDVELLNNERSGVQRRLEQIQHYAEKDPNARFAKASIGWFSPEVGPRIWQSLSEEIGDSHIAPLRTYANLLTLQRGCEKLSDHFDLLDKLVDRNKYTEDSALSSLSAALDKLNGESSQIESEKDRFILLCTDFRKLRHATLPTEGVEQALEIGRPIVEVREQIAACGSKICRLDSLEWDRFYNVQANDPLVCEALPKNEARNSAGEVNTIRRAASGVADAFLKLVRTETLSELRGDLGALKTKLADDTLQHLKVSEISPAHFCEFTETLGESLKYNSSLYLDCLYKDLKKLEEGNLFTSRTRLDEFRASGRTAVVATGPTKIFWLPIIPDLGYAEMVSLMNDYLDITRRSARQYHSQWKVVRAD